MSDPTVVDRPTWLAARAELLADEKALTHQREAVARKRRELPWVRVEKDYVFETEQGRKTLAELFGARNQLVIYHFMYGPDWDEGCPSCSYWADTYDGIGVHLAHRDTTLIAASRAPLDQLLAYRSRMGWSFPWASSEGSDFNFDFDVSTPGGDEMPGLSVFAKNAAGSVFHTYSTYQRGLDPFNAAYQLLDLTPKGRDEDDLEWTMAWLRRHDQYDG